MIAIFPAALDDEVSFYVAYGRSDWPSKSYAAWFTWPDYSLRDALASA